MSPDISGDPADLNYVKEVLRRFVPDRDVLVFGSRATGRARKFSDLDLAIMGDEPLLSDTEADLREAFDESDLPFKVDILEWATTSETFRKIVQQQAVPIQRAAPKGGPTDNRGERR